MKFGDTFTKKDDPEIRLMYVGRRDHTLRLLMLSSRSLLWGWPQSQISFLFAEDLERFFEPAPQIDTELAEAIDTELAKAFAAVRALR